MRIYLPTHVYISLCLSTELASKVSFTTLLSFIWGLKISSACMQPSLSSFLHMQRHVRLKKSYVEMLFSRV